MHPTPPKNFSTNQTYNRPPVHHLYHAHMEGEAPEDGTEMRLAVAVVSAVLVQGCSLSTEPFWQSFCPCIVE